MVRTYTKNERLGELLSEFSDHENQDLGVEMIQSCMNLLRDNAERGDLKVLNKALKELRYAFKVFAPYRHLRKVSVFGSARTPESSPQYQQAVVFGEKIATRGFMVITGAGSGIMAAAHEGAGQEHSFGVNIRLPLEQETNPIITGDPKLVTFRYFFSRKLMFIKETDALVCFPGGFGTMDELFETLTLMQTGKSAVMPIVLLEAPGGDYWKTWDQFIRTSLLGRHMIAQEDQGLYFMTDDVDQACDEIRRFYRIFHSMRQVGRYMVFRLKRPIDRTLAHHLTEEFADILEEGGFEYCSGPLSEEIGEPELQHLPRLFFRFNHRKIGRLRQVIDRINEMEG